MRNPGREIGAYSPRGVRVYQKVADTTIYFVMGFAFLELLSIKLCFKNININSQKGYSIPF
jgi:hypothetical protein